MQTAARRSFDYDMPLIQTPTSACQIRQAWAKVADTPDRETAGRLKDEIKALLKEKNAVLVAHYYVDPLIQDLALETGGCVGDSLEMARFGAEHEAGTLVVAGVRFMGESGPLGRSVPWATVNTLRPPSVTAINTGTSSTMLCGGASASG